MYGYTYTHAHATSVCTVNVSSVQCAGLHCGGVIVIILWFNSPMYVHTNATTMHSTPVGVHHFFPIPVDRENSTVGAKRLSLKVGQFPMRPQWSLTRLPTTHMQSVSFGTTMNCELVFDYRYLGLFNDIVIVRMGKVNGQYEGNQSTEVALT